jgi:hypothetical protein
MGPRTKRSDDGPAMCRGPISFAAGARPLRKIALQRGSTGRNRGSTGPLERVDQIFARSTGPIRDRPLSQLVENDLE